MKSKRIRPDADKLASDADALRMLRGKFAPHVLELAKKLREAAEALMEIDEKMDTEAKEITGDDNYKFEHTVTFDEHGSMNEQLENLGEILGAGFEDVFDMATSLIQMAEEAADDFACVEGGASVEAPAIASGV